MPRAQPIRAARASISASRRWRASRATLTAAVAGFATLFAATASGQQPPLSPRATPTEPAVHPSLPWLATQLLPSPGVALGNEGAQLSLAWQLTPVLWSWGIHRELRPWRFFVVEPLTRLSGSLELHGGAEYLSVGDEFADRWLARGGIRTTLPVWQRGEYVALSVGSSLVGFRGNLSPSYDAGIHFLYGVLGLRAVLNPGVDEAKAVVQLAVRYF